MGMNIEVTPDWVYLHSYDQITRYSHAGDVVRRINVDASLVGAALIDFAVLPNGGYILLDNDTDKVHFIASDGILVQTVDMPNPESSLQSASGGGVGRRFLGPNGNGQIFSVDLDTYEVSIWRDLGFRLSTIYYRDGLYYVLTSDALFAFREGVELRLIAEFPESNAVSMAVRGRFAYVTINFAGAVYRVDLLTGENSPWVIGFDQPWDIAGIDP